MTIAVPRQVRTILGIFAVSAVFLNCSGGSEESNSSSGGSTASGGAASGGQTGQTSAATGGASSAKGGSASGGASSTGGGGNPTGGASTAGSSLATGGTLTTGGNGTGGNGTGGVQTGGTTGITTTATGGNSTGGVQTGGTTGSTGGSPTGGTTSSTSTGPVTCPSTVLSPGNSDKSLQMGGSPRSYTLHVPPGYNGKTAVPLVIDFHGLGGNGKDEAGGSPYPKVTDADNVIMAFPTGAAGPNGNAWNVGPCCVKGVDDVAFAKALVAEISKTACIDPKRVYAVGFSMGGGMSHYLACHAADVFAAVAPAAFDLLTDNVDACKPSRPISVISFRGTDDPLVTYAGGYSPVVKDMAITFLGAKKTFEKWAELNKCTGSASAEDSKGCAKYSGCAGGVDVVLCTKQGGQHTPGDATIGWPLLKAHTLP